MNIQPAVDGGVEKVVAKALDQLGDISTLPEITLKIIETVEDPRSTARDLHEIVMHDLALSARILRVVNSAFYGLPGQVASIERAIVMLGLNAVKNIAIAASLSRVFRGGRISRRFSARDLWLHSVAVGTASKLTVEAMQLPLPDEAFVGGLIHDIGLVVMLQSNPRAMQELMRQIENATAGGQPAGQSTESISRAKSRGEIKPENILGSLQTKPVGLDTLFVDLERKLFGATHEAFGSGLSRRWKFPRSFQYITGYHHRPDQLARENRLLTQVVNVADRLCGQLEIGMTVPVDVGEVEPSVLADLNLTAQQLAQVREQLGSQVDMAIALLD